MAQINKGLLGLFLFAGLSLSAQAYPELSGMTYKDLEALPDWYILSEVSGRLDGDTVEDRVVILESKDSIAEKRCGKCPKLPNKGRIITVLFTNKSTPKVRIQNNRFIARPNEGGTVRRLDPKIKIADKRLRIFYHYERSSNIAYHFEFREKDLVLVYAKSKIDHDRKEMVVKEYDFVKGRLTVQSTYFFDPEKINLREDLFASDVEVIDISHLPMKRLIDFEEMYCWEIAEYHRL